MHIAMVLVASAIVGVACSDDPVIPLPDPGITGTWAGQVATSGTNTCALTQSIAEVAGVVTGTGTLGAPCSVLSFTLAGTNNTGGVADSTEVTWTTPALDTLVMSGAFDGTDTMTGEVHGGNSGCGPGQCPYTFTRTSTTP
jgi:hypothetical protein